MADWCDRARARLLEMETLIKEGRGSTLVAGGGCTDPGGGIVPTTRTAHEMAAMLRDQLSNHGSCVEPQSPPPFGQPLDHIGGSYDWWWWNFGRTAGMPYNPTGRPNVELARDEVRRRLNRPSWGRGVGLTLLHHPNGAPYDAVLVQVQRPEHVALARQLVGAQTDQLYGIPIVYEAVGDIVAAPAGPTAVPGEPGRYVWQDGRTEPSPRELAAVLRNGSPIGFGQGETVVAPVAAASASPWPFVLATSMVGAATSWVIEEIAQSFRGKRRSR
jgi:hypothetical protein